MTVTGLTDMNEIEEELAVFIKNNDIFSITTRGVTTATATGTFAGESSLLINRTNIKNIRSVTVAAAAVAFGSGYTVDYDYDDSGTIKTKITFIAAQTGAYSIPYDYGADKIFTDWPRDEISISSYPRLVVQTLNAMATEDSMDGLHTRTDFNFTITVLDDDKRDVYNYLKTLREKILENKTKFYYIPYMAVSTLNTMLPQPDRRGKIVSCALEITGRFKVEVVS